MERQFDRPGRYDAQARVAAQVRRSPKDVISPPREMTTDMVQPPADAGIGIGVGSVTLVWSLEAREGFDMLEKIGFSGMSTNPVESIQIHDALLCTALRSQQQK